jgi:hypothetical protein
VKATRLLALLLPALAQASCGSAPKVRIIPGQCRINTSVNMSVPEADRQIPGPHLAALILRGYRGSAVETGTVERPARDCTARLVEWDGDRCSGLPEPAPADPRPITSETIFVSKVDASRRLVWVPTDYFDNGEAMGPIALTVFDDRGVVVLTLGTLRSLASRPDFRLEAVGDGQVLIAEGEHCADDKDPNSCVRGTRVLVAGRERFLGVSLVDDAGKCAGRAFFPRRMDGVIGEGAERRRYDMRASVTVTPEAVIVDEDLTLTREQASAQSADATAAAVSRMQGQRRIFLKDGRLVAPTMSLLESVIARRGARR